MITCEFVSDVREIIYLTLIRFTADQKISERNLQKGGTDGLMLYDPISMGTLNPR